MNINKDFRLAGNQYYRDIYKKNNIYLHHTVGGSALSTFNWWNQNPEHVGTAYIIERNGIIYEVFDPSYWDHHLGLKIPQNTYYNKTSIGIELASEGALRSGAELNQILGEKKFDETILYSFDITVPPFVKAKALYHIDLDNDKFQYFPSGFRDFYFYDNYDIEQVEATIELVNELCNRFQIKKALLLPETRFNYDPLSLDFKGILTHCNVRKDKSDLCPCWDWSKLERSFA